MKKLVKICIALSIVLEIGVITIFGIRLYKIRADQDRQAREKIVYLNKNDMIANEQEKFYEMKPNTQMTSNETWLATPAAHTINTDSLNALSDFSEATPPLTYRIMTLGDSFTFGLYVNTKENYPEKLSTLLNTQFTCLPYNNFQVINMGVPGYDIRLAAKRYGLRGAKYHPDLVLWYIFPDDFDLDMFQVMQQYKANMKEIADRRHSDLFLVDGEHLIAWGAAIRTYRKKHSREQTVAMQQANLEELGRAYSGPIVFITDTRSPTDFIDLLKRYAQKRVHTYVRILPSFDRFPDTHPSASGYTTISEDIFAFLKINNILSCPK